MKHYEKADEYFRRALEIDPKYLDALFHIADINRISNKYDEAI